MWKLIICLSKYLFSELPCGKNSLVRRKRIWNYNQVTHCDRKCFSKQQQPCKLQSEIRFICHTFTKMEALQRCFVTVQAISNEFESALRRDRVAMAKCKGQKQCLGELNGLDRLSQFSLKNDGPAMMKILYVQPWKSYQKNLIRRNTPQFLIFNKTLFSRGLLIMMSLLYVKSHLVDIMMVLITTCIPFSAHNETDKKELSHRNSLLVLYTS